MGNVKLDSDEIIILEDADVSIYGNKFSSDITKITLILTNKRLICEFKNGGFKIIDLKTVKMYNKNPLVECYRDKQRGSMLRLQTEKGLVEYKINGVFPPFTEKKETEKWVVAIKETIQNNEVEKVDLIRCRKCGEKIPMDTKFCPRCGTSVLEEDQVKKYEQQFVNIDKEFNRERKDNSICPSCGAFIPSDAISCPSCGNEVIGREVLSSVKEFAFKVSVIEEPKKKAEFIKMYPIPTSKEAIIEFMYLSISNLDVNAYKDNDVIACAWYVKVNQCYKKAKILSTDSEDLSTIERLYNDVNNNIECGSTKTITKEESMPEKETDGIVEPVEKNDVTSPTKIKIRIIGFGLIAVGVVFVGAFASVNETLSKLGMIPFIVGIVMVILGFKKSKKH